MSKKKHPKKFRKQREKDEFLLRKLAEVLSACEKAKMRPKLHYDMVFTTAGYVLPPLEKGGRWDARFALANPYEDVMEDIDLYYTLNIMPFILIAWILSSMAVPDTATINVAAKSVELVTMLTKLNDALTDPRNNLFPLRRGSGRKSISTAPSPSVILSWGHAGSGPGPLIGTATAYSASARTIRALL